MTEANATQPNSEAPVITERDILFECPACGKSLVVDESAEGVILDCPRCKTNVIVPPKPQPVFTPPVAPPAPPAAPVNLVVTPEPAPPVAAAPGPDAAPARPELANLQGRAMTLGNQLKEIQTQRTEITNRLAGRLNDFNRELVMLARLDATQLQIVNEWNQLVGQLKGSAPAAGAGGNATAGRTRVNFGA